MKIDSHVHITPPDIIADWRKIGEKEPYFALLSDTKHNKFADAEGIIAAMDRDGIDKSIIFGFGFQDMDNCKYANDYTIDAVKRYPDRFIGYISVVPNSKNADSEIDRCMAEGLCGIGELFPDGQHWLMEDLDDSSRFASICMERKLPVIIHGNEPVGHYYAGKTTTNPTKMAAFAEHHPELITIFAHWGGGLLFYELMPELRKKFANVYYDTAASPFLYKPDIYSVVNSMGLLDKVLLGSDFPLLSAKRHIRDMEDSNLTEDQIAKICGLNAEKFILKN